MSIRAVPRDDSSTVLALKDFVLCHWEEAQLLESRLQTYVRKSAALPLQQREV